MPRVKQVIKNAQDFMRRYNKDNVSLRDALVVERRIEFEHEVIKQSNLSTDKKQKNIGKKSFLYE